MEKVPVKLRELASGCATNPSSISEFALKRHARSKFHESSVKMWTARPDGSHPVAPSKDDFRKVVDHICKHGASAWSSLNDVGGHAKLRKMILVAANACQRKDQLFFKHLASLTVMRDERKTRLLVRFCAADKSFQRRRGIMGIARGFGSKADEVVLATSKIFTDFATVNRGTRRPRVISGLRRDLRQKCHHCTVDSASNELLATEIQRLPLIPTLAPLTPNCTSAIRDAAHSCRRFLSRPWAADDVIRECVMNFARGPASPARMLQNSLDLQCHFKRYVRHYKPELRRPMANLRAAKHRFETFQKPLGRSILLFRPVFALMCHVSNCADGKPKANAKAWLRWLTVVRVVLCAMMADAADEANLPLRYVDNEEYDSTAVHTVLLTFMNRITDLWGDRKQILTAPGYTSHILELLKSQLVWVVDGATYALQTPTEAELDLCFKHMRGWLKLCIQTCHAEFPSFDYWMSFTIFNGNSNDQGELFVRHCERLAQICGIDALQLAAQIRRLESFVQAERQITNCQIRDAWSVVLPRLADNPSFSTDAIAPVLSRSVSFCGTTSGCEQTFTQSMIAVSDRQNADPDFEWAYWKVKVDFKRDDPDTLFALCQKIWCECYGVERASGIGNRARRIDKGVRRTLDNAADASEAAFLRARRDTPSSTRSLQTITDEIDALDMVWTAKHETESIFQANKIDTKKACAAADGTLLPREDRDGTFRRRGIAQRDKTEAGITTRERREAGHLQATHPEPVSIRDMRGMTAYVERPEFDALLRDWDMRKTAHVYNADVFVKVSSGKATPGDDAAWAAVLLGAYVISPESLRGHTAPVVKYMPAVKLDRALYISAEFKRRHDHVYNVIRMCIGVSLRPKLRIIDWANFDRRLRASDKRVWALVTSREQSSIALFRDHPRQVFVGPSLLTKCTRVAAHESFYGADAWQPR